MHCKDCNMSQWEWVLNTAQVRGGYPQSLWIISNRNSPIHKQEENMGNCVVHFYEGQQPKESILNGGSFFLCCILPDHPLQNYQVSHHLPNPYVAPRFVCHPKRKAVFQPSFFRGCLKLPGRMRSKFATGLNPIFCTAWWFWALNPFFGPEKHSTLSNQLFA